jgi:hypothetical protein
MITIDTVLLNSIYYLQTEEITSCSQHYVKGRKYVELRINTTNKYL